MQQALAEKDFTWLEKRIGYQFQDGQFLQQALMHPSMQGHAHNDRLEFLGDAVLGYAIARYMYHHQQQADSGRLTLLRSSLISNVILAEIAEKIHLNQFVLTSFEINESNKQAVLADAMEALIAAVYLDGGIDKAVGLIEELFASRLSDIDHISNKQLKPPTTVLQEYLQSQGRKLPRYETNEIKNINANAMKFYVASCIVDLSSDMVRIVGYGISSKRAKHAAAQSALNVLGYYG